MRRGRILGILLSVGIGSLAGSVTSQAAVSAPDSEFSIPVTYTSTNVKFSVIIPAEIQIPAKHCGCGFDVGFHVVNLGDNQKLELKVKEGLTSDSKLALRRVGASDSSTVDTLYGSLAGMDGELVEGNKTVLSNAEFTGKEAIDRTGPVYCMAFTQDGTVTSFSEDTSTTVKFHVSLVSK